MILVDGDFRHHYDGSISWLYNTERQKMCRERERERREKQTTEITEYFMWIATHQTEQNNALLLILKSILLANVNKFGRKQKLLQYIFTWAILKSRNTGHWFDHKCIHRDAHNTEVTLKNFQERENACKRQNSCISGLILNWNYLDVLFGDWLLPVVVVAVAVCCCCCCFKSMDFSCCALWSRPWSPTNEPHRISNWW